MLLISEANRNAYNTQYTENLADYYTSGYYEFTPEAEEGQEQPPSEWVYLPGNKNGIYKWDAVLSGSTESEAKSDLQSRKWEKEITASLRNMQSARTISSATSCASSFRPANSKEHLKNK